MTDQPVVVRTVDNTSTAADAQHIDRSWGWRRLFFYILTFGVSLMLAYIIFRRLDRMTDPAIIVFVRYSFYTMWLGMGLYGAQASVSEIAQAMQIFFSGKRIVETVAPSPAAVTQTRTGTKVETPKPAADPAPPATPDFAEVPPWQR